MLRKGVFFCESFIPRADAFTKTGKASKVLGNGIVESGLKHLDNVADGIKKLVKKADDAIDLEKHLPKKLLKEEAEAFAKKADKVADDVVEDAAKAIKSGSKTIPDKARDIAKQVKANNGAPPKGYKGGRTYKNIPLEDGAQKLPEGVNYKEYDINPYVKGQNRGAERIVIGDDGSVWYTDDHYYTFEQIE